MKMTTHPDMALQYSHFLAELKRREGYENVEVRAQVMVSLNGRKPQLLIDPAADLTKDDSVCCPRVDSAADRTTAGARCGCERSDDPDRSNAARFRKTLARWS